MRKSLLNNEILSEASIELGISVLEQIRDELIIDFSLKSNKAKL